MNTGLRRRAAEVQHRFNATCAYHASADLLPMRTVLQPVLRIHNQPQWGSCGGESITGRIEPHVGAPLSGVHTWRGARRRQGDLENPLNGTDSEHVYAEVTRAGVAPYVPGEEYSTPTELSQLGTLAQELSADASRIDVNAKHRTIAVGDEDDMRQLNDALQRDYACTVGNGCNAAYQRLALDDVADATTLDEALGDGHLQGVIGMIAEDDDSTDEDGYAWPVDWRGDVIIQNSWGEDWGGITLPRAVTLTNGVTLPRGHALRGCIRARSSCYRRSWEHDTVEVRFARS